MMIPNFAEGRVRMTGTTGGVILRAAASTSYKKCSSSCCVCEATLDRVSFPRHGGENRSRITAAGFMTHPWKIAEYHLRMHSYDSAIGDNAIRAAVCPVGLGCMRYQMPTHKALCCGYAKKCTFSSTPEGNRGDLLHVEARYTNMHPRPLLGLAQHMH